MRKGSVGSLILAIIIVIVIVIIIVIVIVIVLHTHIYTVYTLQYHILSIHLLPLPLRNLMNIGSFFVAISILVPSPIEKKSSQFDLEMLLPS